MTESKFPSWLKQKCFLNEDSVKKILEQYGIATVCEEASCPNRSECFSRGLVTFLILGSVCTRDCKFCGVSKGIPFPIDNNEPQKITEMVKILGLKSVVITSVTRDDLDDGGACHFAQTISSVKGLPNGIIVEILTPDFKGNFDMIEIILESRPDVWAHNIETVPRLYPNVRRKANYENSLNLLKEIKIKSCNKIKIKSGIMLGLGENNDEVLQCLRDLREIGCDYIVMGQYLQPSKKQIEVKRFVPPDEFKSWENIAFELGFDMVDSRPFARSSYSAYYNNSEL